jgi:hypothetical protein
MRFAARFSCGNASIRGTIFSCAAHTDSSGVASVNPFSCFVLCVQRIEEPFILAVKEELGDRFTVSVETTYRQTIRFILSTLADEFTRCRQMSIDSSSNGNITQIATGGTTVAVGAADGGGPVPTIANIG